MKVLYVASEAVPFVKTGGLADVAGSLPKALKEAGVDVRVIVPKFSQIKEEYRNAMEHVYDGTIPVAWRTKFVGIDKYELDGVIYYFVDNEEYFYRDGVYGYDDDAERFSFFCRAVLNCLEAIDFFPDVARGIGTCAVEVRTQWRRTLRRHQNFIHDSQLKISGCFPERRYVRRIGLGLEIFQ